jgi:hypothetical protein
MKFFIVYGHVLANEFDTITNSMYFGNCLEIDMQLRSLIYPVISAISLIICPLDMITRLTILSTHTLFPFLSPEQRSRVREQMIAGNARSIYHHVGYKTGRSSTLDAESHFWLRFCPQCAEHDREVYGECYWHRLHQAQGVEICPVHKTFLENSSIRARDHVLSAEFVSAERAVGSVAPRLALSSPYFSILQDICTAIQFLLEHPDLALSREVSLSERYRSLLAHQGWVTVNGHVRRTDFVNEFKNTYSPVLLSLLRCEITQPEYLKKTWPYRITRSSQEAQHPLHHILFLRFLGLTVEQFFSQDLKPYQPFGEGPWPCLNPVCTYYQQKHISTSQIHEQNGKGLIVGQFSCECGFTYCRSGPDRMDEDVHRRSKILSYGAAWEAKLRELWFNPTVTLREAAHLLGISLSAVQRQAKRLQLPTPRIALRAARPV